MCRIYVMNNIQQNIIDLEIEKAFEQGEYWCNWYRI